MLVPLPLTPPDSNLSDFGYMPLDVRRLRDSRISAAVSGDEFRAAVLLWCAAWHQVPSASLPDDDLELALLAGYGRVIDAWMSVRKGALHGWIKCSDSRLYHPVVAEKAVAALNQRAEYAWRKECDRIRKENKKRKEEGRKQELLPERPQEISVGGHAGIPEAAYDPAAGSPSVSGGSAKASGGKSDNSVGIPSENTLKGTEGNIKEESPSLRSGDGDDQPPQDAKARLWKEGLASLMNLTGSPRKRAGSQLGALSDAAGGDHELLLAVIREAEVKQPDHPYPWILAAVKARSPPTLFDGQTDPDDPWGLNAWMAKQPDIREGIVDGCPKKVLGGWSVEHCASKIAEAAGLPTTWRGSWDCLGELLRDEFGSRINDRSVLDAVRSHARKVGNNIGSIKVFNTIIRGGMLQCEGRR